MRILGLLLLIFAVLSGLSYASYTSIGNYIDRESGVIVERTLAANTINQLKLLEDVQSLLADGKVTEANEKLASSAETLRYILNNNCSLQVCSDAIKSTKD